MEKKSQAGKIFTELTGLMARLRGPKGCPWDREQSHASLGPYLLEETYELLEAIEQGNCEELKEELGDLLLQILFHCQIASEQGRFGAEEVLCGLKEKLIRRHPHVFSDRSLPSSEAVLQHWARAKASEEESHSHPSSLGRLPKAMPALARAQRVGERAAHLGFDWPAAQQVWDKIDEELRELKTAVASANKTRLSEEMGDALFTLVNLCRFLGVDAEQSLARTVDRFLRRFSYIERRLREKGKELAETSLEEMDSLWEEAKEREESSPHRSIER